MKILTVNNTADIYGASRCLERVFGRFADDGHEIHAVLPEHGPLAVLLEARGICVHIHRGLPIIDRSQLSSVRACLRFAILFPLSVARIAALALKLRIDVIHTNIIVLPSPAVAAFLIGKPHVWHIRELLGEFGRLWKPYQRYIAFFSAATVAISNCTRDQFTPRIQRKTRVIYDGLDETVAKIDHERKKAFRASLPADKLLIGVVGRIKWHRKGQEVLVNAGRLLKERHPEAHYVFIGSPAPGNEEHGFRLRELISASGLEDRVTLAGETEDPISAIAALDIAVVPSVQPEPFGCVVIEAMAAGTPVIGSRCGGIAEQIVDGVSGVLFPPGNAAALADALDGLLKDSQWRETMAAAGQRRVRDAFPLEETYRSMATLFDKVSSARLNASFRKHPLES